MCKNAFKKLLHLTAKTCVVAELIVDTSYLFFFIVVRPFIMLVYEALFCQKIGDQNAVLPIFSTQSLGPLLCTVAAAQRSPETSLLSPKGWKLSLPFLTHTVLGP